MDKRLFVLFVILASVLVACGTTPALSPLEEELTKRAIAAEACGKLELLGTPHPCVEPTATPTPIPTPTATPLGGAQGVWMKYDAQTGEKVATLPLGLLPPSDTDIFGDPGYCYVYYVNGSVADSSCTPWYWKLVFPGMLYAAIALVVLFFVIRGLTAPMRRLAKDAASDRQARRELEKQVVARMQPMLTSSPQPALPQTAGVGETTTWGQVKLILFALDREKNFAIREALTQYAQSQGLDTADDQTISLTELEALMDKFDQLHETAISQEVWEFVQTVNDHASGKLLEQKEPS